MTDPALGLTLVFNGCIYNYEDLRAELRALGHSFFSTSDTEVILRSYAQWGTDCVRRLVGMFAFTLYRVTAGRIPAIESRNRKANPEASTVTFENDETHIETLACGAAKVIVRSSAG